MTIFHCSFEEMAELPAVQAFNMRKKYGHINAKEMAVSSRLSSTGELAFYWLSVEEHLNRMESTDVIEYAKDYEGIL